MQIILTWFEIDRTGYSSYLFSLQFIHPEDGRVKQRLRGVIHVLHLCEI